MREATDAVDSEPNRIEIQREVMFRATGALEVPDEPVETSLVDFGVTVEHRERTSRLDRPEAETFGRDDSPEVRRRQAGEQFPLFADVDTDQRTLGGETAAFRALFGER